MNARRRRIQDIGTLGEILSELQTNQTIHTVDLERFAERIIEQVELGHPIDFIHESPEYPQAFAAAHGLTTAQVMARLVKFDPEMRMHSVSAIVASLVHDVGMLSVPPEVLMTSGSLEGEARRKVESHTTTGRDGCYLCSAMLLGLWKPLPGTTNGLTVVVIPTVPKVTMSNLLPDCWPFATFMPL
jgi:response regulator RpfG family c-di-GMP phosphodiesterase